ncbi:MAG TPA: DUF938 domain-containing protein [Solimonas sp.]|nr:DUF938 domain-containing protein [Solimonas sp.]
MTATGFGPMGGAMLRRRLALRLHPCRANETWDMPDKPFSAASERNREPILAVLREHFAGRRRVLEIGSGTGQHAVYFGSALPHLTWQTGDLAANHPGIRAWLVEAGLPNVLPPIEVDANAPSWSQIPRCARDDTGEGFNAVFSANTLHIMSWPEVQKLFARLPEVLAADAVVVVYGPFNYGGRFTSPSNQAFDATIKTWGPNMGIRDFEAVNALAEGIGLRLVEDRAMPANNRCLVWVRRKE